MLTIEDWHRRYLIQARWTAEIRKYLYQLLNIQTSKRILEVGCGTAVITKELQRYSHACIYGLDINLDDLIFARNYNPETVFCCGDGISLPFRNDMFDLTFCHYLLLWLSSPKNALSEMSRITHPGGIITALAEPDYGGRIDYPNSLSRLGRLQTDALRNQDANPFLGRQLRELFHSTGLINVEVGVLGGQWKESIPENELASEWEMIKADLRELLTKQEFDAYEAADKNARQQHSRIVYVPTFYAWGFVP